MSGHAVVASYGTRYEVVLQVQGYPPLPGDPPFDAAKVAIVYERDLPEEGEWSLVGVEAVDRTYLDNGGLGQGRVAAWRGGQVLPAWVGSLVELHRPRMERWVEA